MGLRDDLDALLNADDESEAAAEAPVDERTLRLREEMGHLLDDVEAALAAIPRLSPSRASLVYRRVLDELVGLPPENWAAFQDVRRQRDAERRQELQANPTLLPNKIARVIRLSDLLYGTPSWEIECGLRRLQQGVDLGVAEGPPI